ncbi:MAG: 4-alpha-glucanotransferase [Erythrobacter sp.]|jgi:4-alpha-glucanotransferase|nr:4-alpha-glucanotransferase [Erythrobacter sp.]
MSDLETLASEAGLAVHWEDAAGEPQVVAPENLERVLAALGLPASDSAEIAESRKRLAAIRREAEKSFITARVGDVIALPPALAGRATLEFESGERREIDLTSGRIEGLDEPGYHRLLHEGGETGIALAPPRAFGIGDAAPGARVWGASVQVPSLKDAGCGAFGDFETLANAAVALGKSGADLLAISPVHALFPADPARFSPYGPSSRRFYNVLFAHAGSGDDPEPESADLIDWSTASPRRLARLRRVFDAMSPSEREGTLAASRLREAEVALQALHDALHAHFAAQGHASWREWPEAYRVPDSAAVRAFAAENEREIAFHGWLQGLAEAGLADAQRSAREAGMAVGLVSDLAVGVDPGGADCWRSSEAFLEGLSVGAPPDLLGPEGQDWGLTTFDPLTLHRTHFKAFRETLAAAMAHAGGVRIDHVLGLRRVWVVPHGLPSSEGCYLAMPQSDLINIVALESWRNRCIVIGEDLGTVPPGLRDEMAEANIAGMRVLWFERDEDGAFTDPAGWDARAAAMTGTHDLPTLAGWWQARDIDWAERLGRRGSQRAERAAEREDLWRRFAASGHASGPAPGDPDTFVTAAIAHVAASACDIALVPLEDLAGLEEQPNLPGTTDQHPNWRRRMPASVPDLLDRPEISERVVALRRGRER